MVSFHDDRNEVRFPLPGTKDRYTWSQDAKFKLMVEFLALGRDLSLLRLEYDTDSFTPKDIDEVAKLIVAATESMIAETDYETLKTRMRHCKQSGLQVDEIDRVTDGVFGAEFDAI